MLLNLRATDGPCGVVVQNKIDAVIRRNPDLEKLAKIAAVLGGAADMDTLEDLSPADIASFKFAPITSTEVERTFSVLKYTLGDRRQCLTLENLKMILIINSFPLLAPGACLQHISH